MFKKLSHILRPSKAKLSFVRSKNALGIDTHYFILADKNSKGKSGSTEYGSVVGRGIGKTPKEDLLQYISKYYGVDAWDIVKKSKR